MNSLNNNSKNRLANAKLKRNIIQSVISSNNKSDGVLAGAKALVALVDSLGKLANNKSKARLVAIKNQINKTTYNKYKNSINAWMASKNQLRINTSKTGGFGMNPGGAAPVVLGGGQA